MIRTQTADALHAAGDRLHALARKIDPPELGVRLVWDDDYQSEGSWATGSDEEDAAAVSEEQSKIESGEWIVVGMIAMERDRWTGEVRETDTPASLWGIVTEASDAPAFEGFPSLNVFDLDGPNGLRGYLRETADEIMAEVRP